MISRILLLLLCSAVQLVAQPDFTGFVNPFIGTGGHGHTFPGATVPFGMVQLSPDTRVDGSWDGCGGYHYSDSMIYGFSHTHLSGTGVSDYGDILLMPMPFGKASEKRSDYASKFSHQREKAGAGWYEVFLDNHKVKAELTALPKVGYHRYTFAENKGAVVLDLRHRDQTIRSGVEWISDRVIRGYRISSAWAKEQHVYFAMEFSQPFVAQGEANSAEWTKENIAGWTKEYVLLNFDKLAERQLEVRVGISFTSMDGAMQNLEAESDHRTFESAKTAAHDYWLDALGRVQVDGGSEAQNRIFYTALYHTLLQPNVVSDNDGKYRGMDNRIHQAEHDVYSVFSLWDTFRAAHPLYAILYPKRQADFIKTFLLMYEQGGRLPVWELAANETDCMIGYHSVSVIADSWYKGIRDFDSKLALDAMVKSATWKHLGLPAYMDNNYLSIDDEPESVSKTLEYAYDDWCIGRFAYALNKNDTAQTFFKRSESWRNLFDAETGFMRPRKNGAWLSPFKPEEVNNHFTEANSWQYSFFVPHNIAGLAGTHGGKDILVKKLQTLFTTSSKTSGREQADITGLIGQYAHGNEPSHHMAWLFAELGEPGLSQEYVAKILNELYSDSPDGLSGNEDCGQMSAWYVFSSMGIYPICPGRPEYTVGNPLFNEIRITPYGGRTFTIKTTGSGSWAKSVSASSRFILDHADIVAGKTITIERTDKAPSDIPLSGGFDIESDYIPAPALLSAPMTFRDSLVAELSNESRLYVVRYTLNGVAPGPKDPIFPRSGVNISYATNAINPPKGLVIRNSCTLKLAAFGGIGGDQMSPVSTARFFKIPHNYTIKIQSKYNPQYTAGGDEGIIDGMQADENWRKGGWQGYQAQDFECVVDLQKPTSIFQVNASFLQDTRSWIVLPTDVEFWYSVDGKTWTSMGNDVPTVKPDDYTVQRWESGVRLGQSDNQPEPMFIALPVLAQYVKVRAKNFGKLPDWHMGAGGEAFIFVDEITVY
jgi:predicted alpha-1,2-mannosidase